MSIDQSESHESAVRLERLIEKEIRLVTKGLKDGPLKAALAEATRNRLESQAAQLQHQQALAGAAPLGRAGRHS